MRFVSETVATRRRLTAGAVLSCIAILAASAFPAPAAPAFPSAAALDSFAAHVERQMQIDKTTGLSLAFQIGDSVWARGFGWADVENRVPATPHSSYRLASITKSMTACAVFQLHEQGKIDLDADIRTYVPDFPAKPFPVTVRQLLQHLGGITHYKNRDVELHIKEHKTTAEAIAIFGDYDLVAEPGTKYSYSTYGYCLLGAAIESASGKTYGNYMRDHVWAPLGMADTRMDDPTAVIPNRVRGYRLVDGQLAHSEFVDISSRFAGGGTRGTVLDLLKFARGYQSGRIVSRASIEAMTAPGVTRDGQATYYGCGWDLYPINGHYMTAHSGGQNETRTMLYSIAGSDCVVAAATNYEAAEIASYARRLAQFVLGELWDTTGGTAAYIGDAVGAGCLANLRQAFNSGLSQYERKGAWTGDDASLRRAFAYFNAGMERKALADRAAAFERIEASRWPANGEAAVVVGWYAATQLERLHGRQRLESYHQTGAIPFFHDFTRITDRKGHARLSKHVEQSLERWNKDWSRTCTPATRAIVVTPFARFEDLEALKRSFAGAVVYPDFSEGFAATTRHVFRSGDAARGMQFARLSHALYPQSAEACKSLALAQLCTGNATDAPELIRTAIAAGDPDVASAGVLRSHAYDLFHADNGAAAVELLRITATIYPDDASIFDALGDLCEAQGRSADAIAGYRRALEIDPSLDATRKALAALEAKAN
jgi:CubicO group peptidase (beta-lactamase class C family)